jgi:excisionase family DNA binding protein
MPKTTIDPVAKLTAELKARFGDRYLRTAELAELMHVSSKTISRWAKDGKLAFVTTLGRHRRYPIELVARQLVELDPALAARLAA